MEAMKFWYVIKVNAKSGSYDAGNSPTKKHESYELALAEAKRLAGQGIGEFYVMELAATVASAHQFTVTEATPTA